MKRVDIPQARCRAAVARCDITPPAGIYHRMWGAAMHDRATGVHRPLEATLLWLDRSDNETVEPFSAPQIMVALDHCILDFAELQNIRQSIQRMTGVEYDNILVSQIGRASCRERV